jgi:hypothetical protein
LVRPRLGRDKTKNAVWHGIDEFKIQSKIDLGASGLYPHLDMNLDKLLHFSETAISTFNNRHDK